MDPERTHLDLRVVDWVQTISAQGSIDPAGHSLRARCSAMDDLRFANSVESIANIPIEVGLSQSPLMVGNGRPLEGGVGIFNYIRPEGGLRVNFVRSERLRPPSAIACVIGLEPNFYNEVWAQVRSGAFSESSISLELASVQSPGRGSLLVTGASFHFTQSRRQPPRLL
jgi:hypothetical protein